MGADYRDLIAAYCSENYESLGLRVYTEVPAGTTIIGKKRRVDVLLVSGPTILCLECKYQDVNGTADEKIPYALADLESPWNQGCLVYAGEGWSKGVLHMLKASTRAAYTLPSESLTRSEATLELDFIVASVFGSWDALLPKERAFPRERARSLATQYYSKRAIARTRPAKSLKQKTGTD